MNETITIDRPMQYIAFMRLKIGKGEEAIYMFCAVDAYTRYAIQLGIDRDDSPENVLKNVYMLTEHEMFIKWRDEDGFTLVLEEFQELEDRIQAIIVAINGKILFDKRLNNTITLEFMESLVENLGNQFSPE